MDKRFLCLLVFKLTFLSIGFSQESATGVLRTKISNYPTPPDTGLVNLLNSISTEYMLVKPDSMIYFASKSIQLARKIKYPLGEARAIGNMAKAYYVKGSYDLSLKHAISAKSASEKINDRLGLAYALNSIGLIHLTQNKSSEAIKDFLRALKLASEVNNVKLQASVYINLGLAYTENSRPDIALKYLGIGLEHCNKYSLNSYSAMLLNRMAETYYSLKKHEKALEHYRLVLSKPEYKNSWEYSLAYSGIARIQLERGLSADAIDNAEKALLYAREVNAKYDISRALKILYVAHQKQNDYSNAFKYLELEKLYSDSLFNEAKEKEINRLNLQLKQAENIQLQKLNEQNREQLKFIRKVTIVIAALALFLLIKTILIFRFSRQKSKLNHDLKLKSQAAEEQNQLILKQNVQLENLNKTKDQLFSIIGHDLRAPFGSIIKAMELMKEGGMSDTELKFFLDGFYEKLRETSDMLDNLVTWASSQQFGIKARPVNIDLGKQADEILSIYDTLLKEKNIELNHVHVPDTNVFADPDHVRIIIQNLIANAIKFTPQYGNISIFYTADTDRIAIHIKDSGIGISAEKISKLFNLAGKEISTYGTKNEKGIGIGLLLVKKFVDENGALISVESREGEGSEFTVSFGRRGPGA
jgi:signal transduction histidine kinase